MEQTKWNRRALTGALAVCVALVLGTPASAQKWGDVKGQVVYKGKKIPPLVKAKVEKDQAHCLKKGPIYTNDLVVNEKNRGVQYCLVWLVDAKNNNKAIPVNPKVKKNLPRTVEIDQPRCAFEPRVTAMMEGQTLVFKNSASVAHNTDVKGGLLGPNLNPTLPAKVGKVEVKEVKARPIPFSISCGIHPWMKGCVGVFKSPYFAVTDKDGKFTIKDAPAG